MSLEGILYEPASTLAEWAAIIFVTILLIAFIYKIRLVLIILITVPVMFVYQTRHILLTIFVIMIPMWGLFYLIGIKEWTLPIGFGIYLLFSLVHIIEDNNTNN